MTALSFYFHWVKKLLFFFFLQYIPTWSFSSLPSTNWLWLLPHTLPNKSHLSYDSWILLDFLFPMKLEGTLLTFPSFIVNWVSLVPTHTLLPPLIWLSLGFDLVLPLHGMALCLYFCATNRVSFFFLTNLASSWIILTICSGFHPLNLRDSLVFLLELPKSVWYFLMVSYFST